MADACLVTGAGGFLGAALVDALLAAGFTVRGLDRAFSGDWPAGAERLQGDICDQALLRRGCEGAGAVFHLAALLPQRHAPVQEMRRVNVGGARAVVDAALAGGVRRLVVVSSAEVYGLPAVTPCPEDAPKRPLGEYGRNKIEAEAIVQEGVARGLGAVILRPPTIIGPRMPERLLLSMLSTLRRGRLVFVPRGRARFQMIAVSDAVAACLVAARAADADGSAFNIGSEGVPPQAEMWRRLRDRVGSRSRVVALPPALLRLLARALLAVGRSPLEPEHVPIAFGDYVFDVTKAREALGWRPAKDNVDALAEAYEWLAAVRRQA